MSEPNEPKEISPLSVRSQRRASEPDEINEIGPLSVRSQRPRSRPEPKPLGLFEGPLWQLTLARWRNFYREPSAVFWTFGFPILLSMALGTAFRNRPPDPVTVGIESGPGAEALQAALDEGAEFKSSIQSHGEAGAALRTGKVDVVVVPGSPRVYRVDPTRPEGRLARALVDDALQRAEGRRDRTPTDDEVVTEPGSRYVDFLIPGLIGMGLMSGGLWGIGYTLVEMRTQKLVKRLLATPMKRSDFLLAFIMTRALFLVVELPVLIGFAVLTFGVPVRGSYALLTGVGVLGSVVFAGIGLLVAARAKNTQTVGGLINVVSMPMYLFSGVFFSSERFPDWMQPIIRALPLTALNDSIRAVMLEGATLAQVAQPALVMAAWGVAAFGLALGVFRWR
ncbi:MAG TPA: ABC transporter permease [Polyangiaceae bacterium]|nr:ABC transporter permease [Polyangiaceae bacterium]